MKIRYALVAILAVFSGLFLMGPTCGGQPASRTFAANSIVIPMDNCYQYRDTGGPQNQTVDCNTTADDGIFRAYGLVYYLIQHGITVYWTISPNKTTFTGSDVTISSGSNVNVVTHWNWNTLGWSAYPANTISTVTYIGGPFIIDGADAPTVQNLIATNADFAAFRSEKIVDMHQVSVGFTAQQVRPLVGPPPRVAIFNYTNGGADITSMTVMHNYVVMAGLETPNCVGNGDCAGGTPGSGCSGITWTVNSGPGKVYDLLCDNDFGPSYGASKLGTGGYKLLWAPHWEDGTNPTTVLQTVSDFVDAGNNLVAECQAITTLEGGNSCTAATGYNPTRFHTTQGMGGNENKNTGSTNYTFTNFPSPNMQIGDFVFGLTGGCLQDWAPIVSGGVQNAYKPGVTHFIQVPGTSTSGGPLDIYAMDHKDNDPTKGLVVYLGGHDYGTTGANQTAGTRLVLNSLFNLGIGCSSPNTTCNTGLLGPCATGTLQCNPNGGLQCVQSVFPQPETCDGIDNNCNGQIDEGLSMSCYTGPPGTEDAGICHSGVEVCTNGTWSACQGQVTPRPEVCNGLDDNCNGLIDENLSRACYDGPPGTDGVGICDAGVQVCDGGIWTACSGEVLPQPEQCNGLDNNCNGVPQDGVVCGICDGGQSQSCYDGPPGTAGVGICHAGTQICGAGGWGACQGEVLPGPSQCNGKDNNCDGTIDTGPCPAGYTCNNGECVPSTCGGELSYCPPGYTCGVNGSCVPIACGDGGVCPPGQICQNGSCFDPCAGVVCGAGATCNAGVCSTGLCYQAGCPVGKVCLGGQCIPDPCATLSCPAGTFCRAGDCVQLCAYQSCDAGTQCSVDGFCEPGAACSPDCDGGLICNAGSCVLDPCAGVSCGKGLVCSGGACIDDPCNDAKCPFGVCKNGQCTGTPPLLDGGATGTGGNGDGGTGISQVKSGCSCNQLGGTDGVAVAVLLMLLGLMKRAPVREAVGHGFSRARRSRGPFDGLRVNGVMSVVAVLALLIGCGGKGGGDGGIGPGGCASGLTACGNACVDLTTSVTSCGTCGKPCEVGQNCQASKCVYVSQNPYLISVDPGQVTAQNGVTLTLAGQSFASGATARLTGTGIDGGDGERALSVQSATQASLPNLDLTQAQPGTVQVRVLNPGRLVSNARTFTIQSVNTGDSGVILPPSISALTPSAAASGSAQPLTVTGSDFQASSTVRLSGGGLAQPTDFTGAQISQTQVYVGAFDLTGVPAGTYAVAVITAGGTSNPLPFTVLPPPPQLANISPTRALKGTQVTLTVNGANFLSNSTVFIAPATGAATALTTQFVSATQLTAGPIDLTNYAVSNYGIYVENPGPVDSNMVGFVVDSNDPSLASATPAGGRQDQSVTVTLSGAGFLSSAQVTVSTNPPQVVPATYVNANTLTLSNWSLQAYPVGNYSLVVTNPGSNPSAPVSFSVVEGQPIIASINPTSADAGQQLNGTMTGQYFYPTSIVYVDGGSNGGNQPVPTTYVSPTQLTVSQSLAGVPVGTYGVTVVNPGPLVSNVVPFTVNP